MQSFSVDFLLPYGTVFLLVEVRWQPLPRWPSRTDAMRASFPHGDISPRASPTKLSSKCWKSVLLSAGSVSVKDALRDGHRGPSRTQERKTQPLSGGLMLCAIAGELTFQGARPEPTPIRKMASALGGNDPDDQSIWHNNWVALTQVPLNTVESSVV